MHTSSQYDRYFQVFALEFFYQVLPWQWFKAQAIAESSLDPDALSPVGALGLMQLMPATAAEMAQLLGIANAPLVPHVNIRLGIAYDRRCWDFWTSASRSHEDRIRFMLGSYNAGWGNILKAQRLAVATGHPGDKWRSIAECLPKVTGAHAAETIAYAAKIERLFAELTTKETHA